MYFAEWTEQGWITAMDAVMQDKAHDPGVVYRGTRKSLYGSSPDSPLEQAGFEPSVPLESVRSILRACAPYRVPNLGWLTL